MHTVEQFLSSDYSQCTVCLLFYKGTCCGYPFKLHRLVPQHVQELVDHILPQVFPAVFEKSKCTMPFVCVEVLRPSQPNGVMSSAVSLPNHTFTGQA